MDNVHVYEDLESLSQAAAQQFQAVCTQTVSEGRMFNVALAGGNTPKRLYETLAAPPYDRTLPWSEVRFFFSDERSVPPDDEASNYRMAKLAMLEKLGICPERIHRMVAETEQREQSADSYSNLLGECLPQSDDGIPQFDLILLGLGTDGHIASLFPHTDAVDEQQRWVVPVWVDTLNTWRMTLTFPVINNAREIMILVAGEEKSDIVAKVIEATGPAETCPARRIQPKGRLRWYLDKAAASALTVQA